MLTAALIALTATTLPSIALADYSYTFRVPVTVTNVDGDKLIQTECTLFDGKNATGTDLSTNVSAVVKATHGSYSGNLPVNVSSGKQPLSYECYILVYGAANAMINLTYSGGLSILTPINGWTGTQFTIANFADVLVPKGALQSF